MDLLDRLTVLTQCAYISDLRVVNYRRSISKAVCAIPTEDYSLKEWNDAVFYITGKQAYYKSAEDARKVLLDLINNEV